MVIFTIKLISVSWEFNVAQDNKKRTVESRKSQSGERDGHKTNTVTILKNHGEMILIHGDNPFYIDKYEFPNQKGIFPKGNLGPGEADSLCRKVGKRLCTEKEWITACMGKKHYQYAYGNYRRDECHIRKVSRSGGLENCRSQDGIMDLSGNLWEWVDNKSDNIFLAKGGSYIDGDYATECEGKLHFLRSQLKDVNLQNFGTRCCLSVKY